ncbi:MAG: YihA family ribosome biogenesis GTP-binding protein, partial [Myxococcota bacterium]
GRMIEGYLGGRPQLKAVVVLLDLRRGIEEDDTQLIEALPHFGLQPILVFTKADKFKRNKRMERRRAIARDHGLVTDQMILTSATKRFGLEELWLRIRDMTGANL